LAKATTAFEKETQAYLPDFCAAGTIFVVVLVAALVAIVLTLAGNSEPGMFLVDLAGTALFVLWLALLSAAVLCRIRGWVEGFGKTQAFVLAYLLLAVLCVLLAEAAWQITTGSDQAVIADSHAGFLLRTFAISSIVIALAMRYLYVASEWRRSIVLEAQSRVSALQALIRPHFLFNSMNTIASLTRSDPQRAEEAVEDLADLLRANLGGPKDRSTLEDELEIAAIYQRIEKLRLGDRLKVRWELGDLPMHALLPNLTIQPLIENAIYHGVELVPEGGEVLVTGRQQGERLVIEISNPVPGTAEERVREGNRMALSNIRQRFELAYGTRGQVVIEDTATTFSVRLEFPLEEDRPYIP
jgi:two-component system, LytTR family, sensor histidine kinase AlgZ